MVELKGEEITVGHAGAMSPRVAYTGSSAAAALLPPLNAWLGTGRSCSGGSQCVAGGALCSTTGIHGIAMSDLWM